MPAIIRDLGIREYKSVWDEMICFTQNRNSHTDDEIWLLQHQRVYTQGTSSKSKPKKLGDKIPLIHSNRGGQITYHGPGQLIAYFLLDIKRLGIGPKSLVNKLEQVIIGFLDRYDIQSMRQQGAPGVYVSGEKIAALGLRISKGCCYHGLSLNVSMDTTPFQWIDPCGFEGLKVTQMKNTIPDISYDSVQREFSKKIGQLFNLTNG